MNWIRTRLWEQYPPSRIYSKALIGYRDYHEHGDAALDAPCERCEESLAKYVTELKVDPSWYHSPEIVECDGIKAIRSITSDTYEVRMQIYLKSEHSHLHSTPLERLKRILRGWYWDYYLWRHPEEL